jgi:hypothetical protein
MRIQTIAAAFGAALLALGLAQPASATPSLYDFNLDDCSGGCGLSDYGKIIVSNIAGGGVTVSVDLTSTGSGLIDTGALSGHTLTFDLSGISAITITGLPASWTYTHTATSFTPSSGYFGTFNYIIDCNAACGPSAPYYSVLNFSITTTSVTQASFASGGTAADAFFVADISNPNGGSAKTGRIGASDPPFVATKVPEPISLSLFGAGLAGTAMLRRRRRKA